MARRDKKFSAGLKTFHEPDKCNRSLNIGAIFVFVCLCISLLIRTTTFCVKQSTESEILPIIVRMPWANVLWVHLHFQRVLPATTLLWQLLSIKRSGAVIREERVERESVVFVITFLGTWSMYNSKTLQKWSCLNWKPTMTKATSTNGSTTIGPLHIRHRLSTR